MRLQQFRPSPAMVVAVIALVFALGGTGMAASKVLFARNAEKVDSIHASRTAKANQLMPLDKKGKLPASLLTLTQGPKGDTGATGAFSDLARSNPSIGPEVDRALSQLGTDRAEADYDEPTITNEEAHDAIAKAQLVVDVVERALAAGLGAAPPP